MSCPVVISSKALSILISTRLPSLTLSTLHASKSSPCRVLLLPPACQTPTPHNPTLSCRTKSSSKSTLKTLYYIHLADSPSSLLHEETRCTMPPRNRSSSRDIHIFDASDRDSLIGGLILTAGVTNANLYTMIEIFVIFNGEYILRNESDTTIEKDDSLLLPGNYFINSPRKCFFNSFFL